VDLGRFRIGLRVDHVIRAADFYRGLGFTDVGSVPGSDDVPVMVMLQREGAMLIVDALVGMPFAPTPREAMIQTGPRGLGIAIGLGVDDLEAAYRWCREAGCEITAEPRDEPYGDRVFECIDPFGYLWEISQPISDTSAAEALASTQASWYGR
jgi:uncharacterized glyoxalase superfamily protein PhnB